MNEEKVFAIIARYRALFKERLNLEKQKHLTTLTPTEREALAHCHAMLDEMEEFVRQKRLDKAFRWLGFIQGVLWSQGVFTLEQFKSHNRRNAPD